MRFLSFLPLLTILTAPYQAFAVGGTSSGGGNSINNSLNPWFLENTTNVTYCLEIDEANMGISYEAALAKTNLAIAYWKEGFRNSKNDYYQPGDIAPFNQVRIATQQFTQEPCLPTTDLRFQFGILSEVQKAEIGKPREFIAIAMRTTSDTANLKGTGYVYVAPQSGILRPESEEFAARPWSECNSCLLEAVIKHELGHVFGRQHSESNDIMQAGIPAYATSKEGVEDVRRHPEELEIFLQRDSFSMDLNTLFYGDISDYDQAVRNLFGLTDNEKILKISKVGDVPVPGQKNFIIEASTGQNNEWNMVGKLCWTGGFDSGSRPAVDVYLSSEQRVFTKLPTSRYFRGVLMAHWIATDFELSSSLCSDRGAPQIPILVTGKYHGPRFIGSVVDNKIDTELIYERGARREFGIGPKDELESRGKLKGKIR